jgi:hypothetical protein
MLIVHDLLERVKAMAAPELVEEIPPQVVNESASFGPFDLKDFILIDDESPEVRFVAQLDSGESLPKGLICTEDGVITGIPAKGTQGNYDIVINATNSDGAIDFEFGLMIKPSLEKEGSAYLDELKQQVWQAVQDELPIPDLNELYNRPISAQEIYYLLERWGLLTIWDAFNLEPPGEKQLLDLEGASEHYNVYDRGSCLVATPKDLYDHERTLRDGLMTARAMAREVYERDWTIQMVGFEKLVRATWVEIQHLGDKNGRRLEVIGFSPSPDDVKLYTNESLNLSMD